MHSSFANRCFDLEAGLKYCVQVSIKDDHWSTNGSFAHRNKVTRLVVTDALQPVLTEELLNVFSPLLLMP